MLAQEEAKRLQHNYIGCPHILVALLDEDFGIASQVLTELGITADALREHMAAKMEPGGELSAGHRPFTARSKKLLELAMRESILLQHRYIGTEHILLAFTNRAMDGMAVDILDEMGAHPTRIREAVMAKIEVAHDETVADVGATHHDVLAHTRTSADVMKELRMCMLEQTSLMKEYFDLKIEEHKAT